MDRITFILFYCLLQLTISIFYFQHFNFISRNSNNSGASDSVPADHIRPVLNNAIESLRFVVIVLSFVLDLPVCNVSFFLFLASSKAFSCFWKWSLALLLVVFLFEAFLFHLHWWAWIDEERRTLLSYLVMIKRNTLEKEKREELFCV